MYQYTSPTALYDEYQARVTAAVHNHALAVEAQENPSRMTPQPVKALGRAWTHLCMRWNHAAVRWLRAIEPAEEGYIA